MSINLSFVVTFFFTTPKAVVLYICTGVGGFLCYIYSIVCQSVAASCKLMQKAPKSAFDAEDMTVLIIYVIARTTPLLDGFSALSDVQKCSLALLRALVSNRYDALLWMTGIMLLALNVSMELGGVAA